MVARAPPGPRGGAGKAACVSLSQRASAPAQPSAADVQGRVDYHRAALERETGTAIDPATWQRGFRAALYDVLVTFSKVLAPFMPFITEEIWQKLGGVEPSIMVAPYPISGSAAITSAFFFSASAFPT